MSATAHAVVVIDYQNVHLTGHAHFRPNEPIHESLICPGAFARHLVEVRNATSYTRVQISAVQVFRGLPEPEHDMLGYQRNLAQKRQWERDPLVEVTQIPLRYRVIRECYSTGGGFGPQPEIEVREKGVDVLCALAVVNAAARDDIDLVIVASHDSDLEPAVTAVQRAQTAKVEGFQWFGGPGQPTNRLHAEQHLWSTRLRAADFAASLDPVDYTEPLAVSASQVNGAH